MLCLFNLGPKTQRFDMHEGMDLTPVDPGGHTPEPIGTTIELESLGAFFARVEGT